MRVDPVDLVRGAELLRGDGDELVGDWVLNPPSSRRAPSFLEVIYFVGVSTRDSVENPAPGIHLMFDCDSCLDGEEGGV